MLLVCTHTGCLGGPSIMAWDCCDGITELGAGPRSMGEHLELLFLQEL